MDVSQGPPRRCPNDGFALVAAADLLASDGDPFLGTTVAGRFVILGRLGAGSMGTVYRARQEAIGREVAIKILRADRAFDAMAKARFSREARAMSLLVSPHTVTVFDFGELPDPRGDELSSGESSLYLAMEMLEGESLGARLKRRGRLPVEEAVSIARQALASLAEAHDKGIIHRDLKPDNLFLARAPDGPRSASGAAADAREICKVLDFGIAKIVHDQGSVDALETQAGTVFGTPRYMSPEQAQGKALDARSDLYALGVLLYQMLVGKPPFVDDDAVVVMARHIKTVPAAPAVAAPDAGIGADLSAVVMRALAKDPADRPESAHAFMAALDRAAARHAEGKRVARADGMASPPYEGLAVARDDLDAVPGRARPARMRRSRALVLVGVSAATSMAAGLLLMTALRPVRVPPARAELAHTVASLRLALMEAEMAAATARAAAEPAPAPPVDPAPSADASASASAAAAPPTTSSRRPGRRYKRFE